MAVVTEALDRSAMQYVAPFDASFDVREQIFKFREEYAKQFGEAVDARAVSLVKDILNGPRTHKYKNVPVTEEQFWQFMETEGFHKPASP